MRHKMHRDAPREVRGDVELYVRWRVEHHDADEGAGMSDSELRAVFAREWYAARRAAFSSYLRIHRRSATWR